jgi:hypothetical protein
MLRRLVLAAAVVVVVEVEHYCPTTLYTTVAIVLMGLQQFYGLGGLGLVLK